MLLNPQHFSKLVAFALGFLIAVPGAHAQAPKPPEAPKPPQAPKPAGPAVNMGDIVTPQTLQRLFKEAEDAFAAKAYDKAVAKIQELLKDLGPDREAPYELLYFNIGLGYLLGGKAPEAETAFTDCLKKFPKGEYASRNFLGVGRACIIQGTPEKKDRAIEALKLASLDPRYRSEAGLMLGQVFLDLKRDKEAMLVFKSLMGSDIHSPAQTTAAVEVIGLLTDGKIEDLILYLDRLSNQSGVRDALAWYTNQVIVRGDALVGEKQYEIALAIYRSIPPRAQILEIQKLALESQKRDVKILEARVAAEQNLPINRRSNASDLLSSLKPAVELAEKALDTVEKKEDLDAAILMRRGRCLYHLPNREEEALVCFRALRNKYGSSEDAKTAAYAEIVLLHKLKDVVQIKTLCDAFLKKYPTDENAENVASLAGEVLVKSGKWDLVGKFYRDLEAKFPTSQNLERFVFFQGVASFQDANFKESTPLFNRFLKSFPNSPDVEKAYYFLAMSYFMSNEYKETLKNIKEYLTRYPNGDYAGDMRYRLAFIDFNDKTLVNEKPIDNTSKIIQELTAFLIQHPTDASAGSMFCLLADTYKKKTSDKPDDLARFQLLAIDAYKKAINSPSLPDVVQYALESATTMLQAQKDWPAIAAMHNEFIQKNPDSPQVLISIGWIIKCLAREGKIEEATEIVVNALKSKIGDPSNEQVESLIDELVKTVAPKKVKDANIDDVDKQLVEVLNKAIGSQANATTNARIYYARARLAQHMKRTDRSDLYLKGIATINSKDPSVLSPALLAASGEILLKMSNQEKDASLKEALLEEAKAMFNRLIDRYKDGMYADAGPIGRGNIALMKQKPLEALKIFDDVIERNPGNSRIKEATLGKLEAMIEVGQLEEAEKLATATVGDRSFRGESAGKANLLLARLYRKQSVKAADLNLRLEILKKSHAISQRVYVTYKTNPEVCAEGYYQSWITLKELGSNDKAEATLKEFMGMESLKNTEAYKKALADQNK